MLVVSTVSVSFSNAVALLLCFALIVHPTSGYHDCVELVASRRRRRRALVRVHPGVGPGHSSSWENNGKESGVVSKSCGGGLCVGMKDGPHEGGKASYPVAFDRSILKGTTVRSTMTVPDYPVHKDGITYYIWTDVFFGDAGFGRMNQFVPQLILGSALDGSSGPPDYIPRWGRHETYRFAAHYFFETYNATTKRVDAHAAYGDMFPAHPGEVLWTEFRLEAGGDGYDVESPRWILSMGAQGDPSRTSTLVVDRPYMGLGLDPSWGSNQTKSWNEDSYRRMCINACWEFYGADDVNHLPSSGASYDLVIEQPRPGVFAFQSEWEQDEGKVGGCPSSVVREQHNESVQHVKWDISVDHTHQPHDAGVGLNHEGGSLDLQWKEWKVFHASLARSFGSATNEDHRRSIFMDNINFFESRGGAFMLDESAVLTADEFRERGKAACSSIWKKVALNAREAVERPNFSCPVLSSADIAALATKKANISDEIDYRGTQVTPVKNQGAFGTCWSFGFVETVEGLGVRQGGALVNVSNQEVIDCCPACRGSAQDASFGFAVRDARPPGRLAREGAYPYRGPPGNCTPPVAPARGEDLAPALVGGCLRVADDEEKTGDPVLSALDILGPGAFGIDASCLRGYAGGVIVNCTGEGVDHEVLLVGAGVDEESGVPFFRAKNSWGVKWGEEGYFRFARRGGQLGFGSVVFATSTKLASTSVDLGLGSTL